jgi:hypothetical protein
MKVFAVTISVMAEALLKSEVNPIPTTIVGRTKGSVMRLVIRP